MAETQKDEQKAQTVKDVPSPDIMAETQVVKTRQMELLDKMPLMKRLAVKVDLEGTCNDNGLLPVFVDEVAPVSLEAFDGWITHLQNCLYVVKEGKLVKDNKTLSELRNCLINKNWEDAFGTDDIESIEEHLKRMKQVSDDLVTDAEQDKLGPAIAEVNVRIDKLLEKYNAASSSVRMQLARQLEYNRRQLQHMLLVREDLSILRQVQMKKFQKTRRDKLGDLRVNVMDLEQAMHFTTMPQLPLEAVGVNYSFISWEDESSALDRFIPQKPLDEEQAVATFVKDDSNLQIEEELAQLKIEKSTRETELTELGEDKKEEKKLKEAAITDLGWKIDNLNEAKKAAAKADQERLFEHKRICVAKAALKAKRQEASKLHEQTIKAMMTKKPVFSKGRENAGDGSFRHFRYSETSVKSQQTGNFELKSQAEGGNVGVPLIASFNIDTSTTKGKSTANQTAETVSHCYSFEILECDLMSAALDKMQPFLRNLGSDSNLKVFAQSYVPVKALFVQKEALWDSSGEVATKIEEASQASTKKLSAKAKGSWIGGGFRLSSTETDSKRGDESEGKARSETVYRGNLSLAILFVQELVKNTAKK